MRPSDVVVYEGAGSSPFFLKQMLFQELDPSRHRVIGAQARDIVDGRIFDSAALFVLPGGEDKSYCADLGGAGYDNIRQFARNGGVCDLYCAGAYAGSRRIDFTGRDKSIQADRELALFDGTAIGSITAFAPPYDTTLKSAAVVDIVLPGKSRLRVHYHGGPRFMPAPGSDARPLAWYIGLHDHALAAVQVPLGQGRARLFGVHPEVSAVKMEQSLDSWPGGTEYRFRHLANLQRDEVSRRWWMRSLLADAGLTLAPITAPVHGLSARLHLPGLRQQGFQPG